MNSIMDLAAIMLCVALHMRVDPIPIPPVIVAPPGYLKEWQRGRYEPIRKRVVVRVLEPKIVAHEFTHAIQMQVLGVRWINAGRYPWENQAWYMERKCG